MLTNEQLNEMMRNSQSMKDYKNHHFSEEFKKQLDRENKPGTRIIDTISGEVYITK